MSAFVSQVHDTARATLWVIVFVELGFASSGRLCREQVSLSVCT